MTAIRLPFPQFQTDEGDDENGNPLPGQPVELKKWDDRVTEVLIDFLEKLDAQAPAPAPIQAARRFSDGS